MPGEGDWRSQSAKRYALAKRAIRSIAGEHIPRVTGDLPHSGASTEPPRTRRRALDLVLLTLAAAAIVLASLMLHGFEAGVSRETIRIGDTPATVYRGAGDTRGPAVVIAHGFAGSQQLMQSFALEFARRGSVAVTFDFLGHGRNPNPLAGDIADVRGATQALVAQTASVVAFARSAGDGQVAILGHSMASDIVVRAAQADAGVAATVAVSMFSPAVTATAPKNLLVIAGAFEGALKAEALKAVDLVAEPRPAREAVTYGRFADGTARRAVFADGVEHVGVLFSPESVRESADWLDGTFRRPSAPGEVSGRGRWILLLLGGLVLLARPLSWALPVVSARPLGAGLSWRRAWPAILGPALATPVILRFAPTHFLPVIVGDYLAAHFALYGALVGLALLWLRRGEGRAVACGGVGRLRDGSTVSGPGAIPPLRGSRMFPTSAPKDGELCNSSVHGGRVDLAARPRPSGDRSGLSSILGDPHPTLGRAQEPPSPLQGEGSVSWPRLALAAALVSAFSVAALGFAVDRTVTSFALIPERLPLFAAMLVGTSSYFLANEWLTRGEGAGRGLRAASQVAFLASLGLAVALDFHRLFFLLIIVPVIVPVFVVSGLIGAWSYRRTGHPAVPAMGAAALFAWAIAVTFPMLAG